MSVLQSLGALELIAYIVLHRLGDEQEDCSNLAPNDGVGPECSALQQAT